MVALLRLARILSLAAAPALAAAGPAAATASLTCEADDRNLSFDLLGNICSGDGGSIQLIEGRIKLRSVRGKFDAREFRISPKHLSGQWSFGKELRIGISPESAEGLHRGLGPQHSQMTGEQTACRFIRFASDWTVAGKRRHRRLSAAIRR